MQQLYDTVRAAGAQNLVIIGGLDWAYDLSGCARQPRRRHNIVYATHPYTDPSGFTRPPSDWGRAFGFLTATDPVVATEFGVLNDSTCSTAYQAQLISYLDAHFAGWTAWAWYPGACTFPNLIDDWSGTPSLIGVLVKAALIGYGPGYPPASPPRPLGLGVNFTFNHGLQGWESQHLRRWPHQSRGDATAGGAPPALAFNAVDGHPIPARCR